MAEFGFSCWTYFSINRAWDTLAKDYCDLGLNMPLTPVFNEGDEPEKLLRLLDRFHALGMKAIVFDNRVTARGGMALNEEDYRAKFRASLAQFGGHPAVYGFYVGDEPDAPDASNFFAVARMQREEAPNLTPFLNLLPWFDWIGERIGSPAYGPYLDRAVTEGNLALLGWDCYTQMWEGDSGWDAYFNNLREMKDASLRHGVPFMNTVLSSGHYDYACPDQDAFRWQISTSAALGAKAVCYFYVMSDGPHDNYRCFPINAFHERTASFGWLSEENRYFQKRLGAEMMDLTIEKAEFTGKSYGGLPAFAPDDGLLAAENAKGVDMLVSTFRDKNGVRYRTVVNLDRKKNIEAHLIFAPGVKVERKQWGDSWQILTGPMDAVGALSDDGRSVRMWLAPGQIELLRETK